jgi:hypothetical protein
LATDRAQHDDEYAETQVLSPPAERPARREDGEAAALYAEYESFAAGPHADRKPPQRGRR